MTWLRRTLRNAVQRLASSYYEGPDVPPRLRADVRWFRSLYPHASPDEWQAYVERAVANAYRDGFTRGLEWNERLWPGPSVDPEELAKELRAHGWMPPEPPVKRPAPEPPPPGQLSPQEELRLRHKLAHVGARIVPFPERPRKR